MSDPRASAYRALASESRVHILHILQGRDGPCTVDEVAAEVGLHVNTTREHLDRLVETGFVARTSQRRSTRGRPRKLYSPVERAAAATMDSRAREHLTKMLLDGYGRAMVAPERSAEEAGRRWAVELDLGADEPLPEVASAPCVPPTWDQLAALERHFEDLGFEPEADPDGLEVHLRRCPLRDLARDRTEIVCSVHLGLARGVLAAQGGPLIAERLEPFVGPHHCILHLRRS